MKKQKLIHVAQFTPEARKFCEDAMKKLEQERLEKVTRILEHYHKEDKKIREEKDRQEAINRARILHKIRGGRK